MIHQVWSSMMQHDFMGKLDEGTFDNVWYVLTFAVCIYLVYKLWNPALQPSLPKLYYQREFNFCDQLIESIPLLTLPFAPPKLWGYSGHLQTIMYGVFDRVVVRKPQASRIELRGEDGQVVIYHVAEPKEMKHDITMLICPGIANSYNSPYICTFVHHAMESGYRCAVLNHVGSDMYIDQDIDLKRIFTYGGTADFITMAEHMMQEYSSTKFICVGFSMGGNIVTKYISNIDESQRKRLLCGVSLCQGYDILLSIPYLTSWTNWAKAYHLLLVNKVKTVIMRNEKTLIKHEAIRHRSSETMEKIYSSTSLIDIDEHYTRHVHGYETLEDFYRDMSCINSLPKLRDFPMLFLNSADDPLVPVSLTSEVIKYVSTINGKAVVAIVPYGGHLGFFDGGDWLIPEKHNWMDRVVIQYCDAVAAKVKIEDAKDEKKRVFFALSNNEDQ